MRLEPKVRNCFFNEFQSRKVTRVKGKLEKLSIMMIVDRKNMTYPLASIPFPFFLLPFSLSRLPLDRSVSVSRLIESFSIAKWKGLLAILRAKITGQKESSLYNFAMSSHCKYC